jgi:hypothetical protein
MFLSFITGGERKDDLYGFQMKIYASPTSGFNADRTDWEPLKLLQVCNFDYVYSPQNFLYVIELSSFSKLPCNAVPAYVLHIAMYMCMML